jgi:iron uptake system component EfeO
MNRLRLWLAGAIAVLALVVIALVVVLVVTRGMQKPAPLEQVAIEVSDTACTPSAVTVGAGTPRFAVKNTSNRVIEWEILNGVMVVAERENIAPGFTVELTPRLEPGSYQMTCGLLSNPKGTLTVTAAGGTAALPAPPRPVDLVAPTAEYRVYAIQAADALDAAAGALKTAVAAGDMAAARTHAAEALAELGHLAPVLHLFHQDADALTSGPTALSALAGALAASAPPADLPGLVDTVAQSAKNLAGSVHATTPAPHEIIAGAATVATDLAKGFDDPAVAAARIAGVRKVVNLFQLLTVRADKTLAAKLETDLSGIEAALAKSPTPDAKALAPQLTELGADLVALLSALGLNTNS